MHNGKLYRQMRTLRLICTYKCPRNCEGCCNKQEAFHSDNIPVFDDDFTPYDMVIVTGGEPLIDPAATAGCAMAAKAQNPDAKLILYTAMVQNDKMIEHLLRYYDGITITLHEQADVDDFRVLNFWLQRRKRWIRDNNKTLRLNVFKGVDVYMQDDSLWKIKDNIEWIPDCPLPAHEEIKKLKYMF
jgi:hypothetical protein